VGAEPSLRYDDLVALTATTRCAMTPPLCSAAPSAAATAYADAARRATNVAERGHLVRQAARARAGERRSNLVRGTGATLA